MTEKKAKLNLIAPDKIWEEYLSIIPRSMRVQDYTLDLIMTHTAKVKKMIKKPDSK